MIGRRIAVAVVVVAQVLLLVRGVSADHKEFAFRMFPEASRWRAEVVRVTDDGRIPVDDGWSGYEWADLVRGRGLSHPGVWHHADAGIDNQLAFLDAALDWVAANTPADTETRYLEATVTYRHNGRADRRPSSSAAPAAGEGDRRTAGAAGQFAGAGPGAGADRPDRAAAPAAVPR